MDGPYDSVWDAIESDPGDRARMKLLDELMNLLEEHIAAKGWTQTEAAEHLGVTQPRISDLMRGKIHLFSIDSALTMLWRGGVQIELRIKSAA